MVSLWPWKKDDSSPASFEKALSVLSTKITNTQARLEQNRASSRRVRVLSTLYLSFAYLVYAIVALLVVGWKNMGAYEWSGMAGGPVLIYLVRTGSSAMYDLRIEGLSAKLKELQEQRAKTIQKLKDATKYDSTLELLEKYGGGEGKPRIKRKNTGEGETDEAKKAQGRQQQQRPNEGPQNRTHMPVPATANIQRGNTIPPSNSPTPQQPGIGPFNAPQGRISSTAAADTSAEFAPNAYDVARSQPPSMPSGQYEIASQNHWYDRIMDLLLGEDETAAKNRIVLICKQCRLVNGQAPPGTNSLAELGMWKCMACAAMNGEENEGKRIVKEVLGQTTESTDALDDGEESDLVEVQSDEGSKEEEVVSKDEASGARKRTGKGK
ncbi:Protein lunapark [Cytospora mali]|uniref:Endoplasmic reticulum junction formation protein lunapark n=1 Tax=Cytospora mali TaxID=578113 RepID=A0A194VZP0_CYTMA|nr:Protein lunapark [Valsa mali]